MSNQTTPALPAIDLPPDTRLAMALKAVADETRQAMQKHNPMNSAHEAYAVIKEELDEFWREVMKKREARNPLEMKTELVQIAAMACRTIVDLRL